MVLWLALILSFAWAKSRQLSGSRGRSPSRGAGVRMGSVNDVMRILEVIEQGHSEAAEQLLPLVYQGLRKLAAHKMTGEAGGHTLQATALVYEAWIRLVDGTTRQFQNRQH